VTAVIKSGGVRMHELATALGSSVAMEMLERDQLERDAARRAELDQAYQRGLADGRAAAETEGTGAIPALVASLERSAVELAAVVARRTETDGQALGDAAVDIADWVLGREIAAGRIDVVARIEQALVQLVPTATVTVHVAESLVESVRGWTKNHASGGYAYTVAGDAALRPGEARISAGHGEADLTFAGALARVRSVLDADGADA
jgi:flagellar biosynthesis/type III secretory pathway protein FliH